MIKKTIRIADNPLYFSRGEYFAEVEGDPYSPPRGENGFRTRICTAVIKENMKCYNNGSNPYEKTGENL